MDDRLEPPIQTEFCHQVVRQLSSSSWKARESRQLLRHALTDADKHGRSSREPHVEVQILADSNIIFHDRLERGVVDAACFLSNKRRL